MKVLVIDEDKFIRNLFISELTQENILAETASDGETGMAMIKEHHPDIIVLDLILPKRDGFSILEEIKKLPKTTREHTGVYVFSSLGQEQDKAEALALGATEYFAKNTSTVRNVVDIIRARYLSLLLQTPPAKAN